LRFFSSFFKTNDLNELFSLDDESTNTETSALFAGTDSQIKPTDTTSHNGEQPETHDRHKKHKKKKKKDKRTVDGNEIPHLAKITKNKHAVVSDTDNNVGDESSSTSKKKKKSKRSHKDSDERRNDSKADEYVLGKLFKTRKTKDGSERAPLVHTVMQHDRYRIYYIYIYTRMCQLS
jgi:hypothetical protein